MKRAITACALTLLTATGALATETTWTGTIKGIFDKQCSACHGSNAPEYAQFKKEKQAWTAKGIGMRMDSYSLLISYVGWPQTGALMRRLDDGSGSASKKPGNMYQYLGATEAERQTNLALFKSWVGTWNLKRWADSTKEELTAIKVTY